MKRALVELGGGMVLAQLGGPLRRHGEITAYGRAEGQALGSGSEEVEIGLAVDDQGVPSLNG